MCGCHLTICVCVDLVGNVLTCDYKGPSDIMKIFTNLPNYYSTTPHNPQVKGAQRAQVDYQ